MSDNPSSRAIKDFLGEAEEIIEKLNLDLVILGDALENSADTDPDLLNSIFRGAHSFKGLSGMFGFDDLSELSHHMENLLDSLRLGKIPFTPALVETLYELLDVLMKLVHGKGESESYTFDLTPYYAKIDAVLRGDSVGKAGDINQKIDPELLKVLTEYEEHRLNETLKKGKNLLRVTTSFSLMSFDQDLAALTDQLKKKGEVISTLPSAGEISDRIGFQLLVGSSLGVEELSTLLQAEDVTVELLVGPGVKGGARIAESLPPQAAPTIFVNELTPQFDEISPAEGTEEGNASLRSISRTVRVDIDKLDSLMNIVGELVLSKSAIVSLVDRLKSETSSDIAMEMQKASRGLERRLEELQKGVMDVRMVPIAQLFEKMVRIVRRVSSEHGKKVTLDIRGADTELDKLIVEDLSDPLMHIIRNSIDHGIESVEDRLAVGKPEKGTICLWASQKGNHVVIEVRDDGHGINFQKVRRKAIEKGLIGHNVELSKEDIYNLIFLPGFSTRDQVSDLSGRGVGMDVVKNNIAALSGMITIDSNAGSGTSMVITLPITLAIIKALIVQVSGKTYAIPINSVLETLMVNNSEIRTIERREVIELRQTTLPLLRLTEIFGLEIETVNQDRSFVVVTGMAEKRIGIVVDELLGQQDVVIKSLGNTLSFVKGIAGAADLGNQKTILVLDVGGLMSEALRGESAFHV